MTRLSERLRSGLRIAPLAWKRAAELLTVSARITPDEWARRNRVYPASAGRPGARDPGWTPYVVPFVRFFADNDRYDTAVLVTGAQSGKTDGVLDVIGWRLDTRPRPQLYVGPSKDFVTEQFEPRLMALFDQSSLRDRVARGKRNKRTRKIVNGVQIRLAWAGSATSLASDQAADIYVDEYDKMFRVKGLAGDPFELAKQRGQSYADRKIAAISTPTDGRVETYRDEATGLLFWKYGTADEIGSPIWLKWQEGTMHHFAWRCPHCREWFIPRIDCLRWAGFPDDAQPGEASRSAFVCCPVNGCVIDESARDEMNAGAVYVAPGQIIGPDGVVSGAPVQDTHVLSLFASPLASPMVKWGEAAAALVTARSSGIPGAERAVVNNLGELFYDRPARSVSVDEIAANIVPGFRMGMVPPDVMRITLGADVQGDRIVYVVRGWGGEARSWLIERDEVPGPTAYDEVWSRFALVLQRTYGGLRIERALIDSGFRPDKPGAGSYHKVYEFCRRWHWVALPTKGHDRQSVPVRSSEVEAKADGRRDTYGQTLLHVDTDYFKSLVHSRLSVPLGQAGSFHLPEDAGADYFKQLVSEVRTGPGVWTQISKANHYFDAEVLAAVGGFLLQVHRIPAGKVREMTPEDAARETPTAPMGAVIAKTMTLKERMAARAARINQETRP